MTDAISPVRRPRRFASGLPLLAAALGLVVASPGAAATPGKARPALRRKIALLRLDPLGIDAERVDRLETLFRNELARLTGRRLPTRRRIARAIAGTSLAHCQGQNRCLAAIGHRLGVGLVISGNVAALGDSYVINLKVVDADTGKELRRISSPPLRGSPDELIDAVRVAAYRLLAPRDLVGEIAVLADLRGAEVEIDGRPIGKTPLAAPIGNLALGKHRLSVHAEGYDPFTKTVNVRFQKTTRVVVRLAATPNATRRLPRIPLQPLPARKPWYSSPWVYVGVGAAAVLLGAYVGHRLGRDTIVDCSASNHPCVSK